MKKKELTAFSKWCIASLCVLLFILFITGIATRTFCKGVIWLGEKYNHIQIEQKFDVSTLSNWCGKPTGTIHMVGATVQKGILIDELGNIWNNYDKLEENNFYLLWIDDMGTEETKDDEILKVWREE